MTGQPLLDALVFLVRFAFGLVKLIFLLRILLQLARANFFNPVCQFIVKATNPILVPLSKVIPRLGRFDTSAALVLWLLLCVELAVIIALRGGQASILAIATLGLVEGIDFTLIVMLVVLFAVIIFSWFQPTQGNPVIPLLYQLGEPLLAPARRLLPALGGIDFSPILVFLAINLLRIMLVAPLRQLAAGL